MTGPRFVHVINSLRPGGAERQLVRVLASLRARHPEELHRIVLVHDSEHRVLVPEGVEVFAGPRSRLLGGMTIVPRLLLMRGLPRGPLVGWMYHGGAAAALIGRLRSKRGVTVQIRHGGRALADRSKSWPMRILARFAERGGLLVFNSETARRRHLERWSGAARSEVVPNGIECDDELPDAEPLAGAPRVGFIGRAHPDKGFDLLPEILAAILARAPEARLHVVGVDESEMRACLANARHGGLAASCEAHGVLEDVRPVLRALDVLLVPSRVESFPNVALEAMRCGVPVSHTGVGELPEIFADLLPASADVSELARACLELAAFSDVERASLAARMRERIESRYAIDVVASRLRQLWLDEDARHSR